MMDPTFCTEDLNIPTYIFTYVEDSFPQSGVQLRKYLSQTVPRAIRVKICV